MTDVFLQLVSLSKIISIMIITVIVLRMILNRAPKKVHKMLWLIVGIRSCLPFYIKSRLGIIPSDSVSATVSDHGIIRTEPVSRIFVSNVRGDTIHAIDTGLQIKEVMTYIWIAGVLLFMMYICINFIRTKKSVADASHFKDDIYTSDSIPSPFIIGYLKPKIYIFPEMNEVQQELIVAHERCHLKNKDHILKVLGFILLGVYWFNPLMWLAYFLFCKDIELSCDEEVIKSLPFGQRKEYAIALLDSARKANTLIYSVAFCENNVKERVVSVMNYKKPRFWIIVAAIVACIAVLVVFFTVNKAPKQPEYITYEFETYDGTVVKIDETNIISQQVEKDVLETSLVPEDAEVIAPGRDYVYLEDEEYYYVEDVTKGLVTIASKDNTTNTNSEVAEYAGDGYSFKYKADSFYLFEDAENGAITVSYDKDGVEMAGSNVITFTRVDGTNSEDLIKEKVRAFGGKESDISEVNLNENVKKAYVYSYGGESENSGLKTVQTYYTIQCKDFVILADMFRTVGPDDKVETTIDADLAYVLQSFTCK